MKKHAFLIIAHNEFDLLNRLILAIDDERCDIFVHFDLKVKELPQLTSKYSNLYIIKNRIDVRWGNYSQILCELSLLEESHLISDYSYYHIISGTHIPIVSKDRFYDFFESVNGKQIIQKIPYNEYDMEIKTKRYNLFTKYYQYGSQKHLIQKLWRLIITIQERLKIFRNKDCNFVKATNWVCITDEAVEYLLSNKKRIISKYRYSFCGDEIFIPTELTESYLKETIYYYDKLLKCDFIGSNPKVYTVEQYDEIISSGCIFARKFSSKSIEVVNKIYNHTQKQIHTLKQQHNQSE